MNSILTRYNLPIEQFQKFSSGGTHMTYLTLAGDVETGGAFGMERGNT